MAERRMFAKTIIDSDAFLDMPLSSQALYFHLGMRADDRGFINNAKKIQRMLGASDDDLRVLISKKFVLVLEDGLLVVKHWNIHNSIRRDMFRETKYTEMLEKLYFDENNAYTTQNTNKPVTDTLRITSRSTLRSTLQTRNENVTLGKDSIGKVSIVQDSIGKVSKGKDSEVKESEPQPAIHISLQEPTTTFGEFQNVRLTNTDFKKIASEYGIGKLTEYIDKLSTYMHKNNKEYPNHAETISAWLKKDTKGQAQ